MALPYSQKPIDELMEELEALGGSSQVRMNTFTLLAVTNGCQQVVGCSIDDEDQPARSFLTLKGYRKKYHYHQLHSCLSTEVLSEPLVQFYSGFNVNVILLGLPAEEVARLLPKSDEVAISHTGYHVHSDKAVDLIAETPLQPRSDGEFYANSNQLIRLESQPDQITVTRVIYPSKTNSELRLVALPSELIRPSNNQVRSQLSQIVEYIRQNRDKFSKDNISKIFIKKSRAVSVLIDTVFDNSLNWLVNRLDDREQHPETVLEYVNRFKGLPCFARRASKHQHKINEYHRQKQPPAKKIPARNSSHSRSKDQGNPIVIEQELTHQTELDLEREDFNFCRSLERKTHKYSTSPTPSQTPNPELFRATVLTNDSHLDGLPANERISIIQAEHMIEISKYHQTIQSLNAKLLSLQKQNGLEELCGIYEREIMQLELRLDELRQQLGLMAQGDEVSLKKVVRKLTEQLSAEAKEKHESPQLQSKQLSKAYQVSTKEFKLKLEESEKNRQLLADQLRILTKRLQIRQTQVAELTSKLQQYERPSEQSVDKPTLNVKTEKQYSELVTLLQELNEGNGLTYVFIRKKLSALFETLTMSKAALVECRSFLLELQTLLEARLSASQPTIVLDCNRFIRTFLLKTLQIQQ